MALSTAVVLGSGTSGMLAACVLSDSISEAVMIDRRPVDPVTCTFAGGVPQADHRHVCSSAGSSCSSACFRASLVGPPRRALDTLLLAPVAPIRPAPAD